MDLQLSDEQQEIILAIRRWVKKDVIPHASRLEHGDEYPTEMVEQMKRARAVRRHHPRAVRWPWVWTT